MARLLILDDEESILFAMSRYFRSKGFDVDVARELEEAEAMVVNIRYDLLIADLRLTGVHGAEGLEMADLVRERCPWMKTILLTAYGSPELEVEAKKRGATLLLRKPKPLSELAELVTGILGGTA
jgi:two-component system nitrogen regulation response regulator GlnG